MCRLVEYLGPEIPLSHLISDPPHSLVVQSYRPREMVTGTVNADGFGVGWYPPRAEGDGTPCLFTSPMPIWADPNLARLGPRLRSHCIAASVRSATPGMPIGQEHCQPFTFGPYLFMHNGFITDFRRGLMRRLRAALREEPYVAIGGSSDSEHVFGLFLDCLHDVRDRPDAMVRALERTLALLSEWTAGTDIELQLNCAVTDGSSLAACRFSNRAHAPSLYVTDSEPSLPGGLIIASEPLFANEHWRSVRQNSVISVDGRRELTETAIAA